LIRSSRRVDGEDTSTTRSGTTSTNRSSVSAAVRSGPRKTTSGSTTVDGENTTSMGAG
jgi:hypothetical protein